MSYVIRIYAMRGVLGTNGVLNNLLMNVGFIDASLSVLLFSLTAVKLALIVILLPFATVPTFVALERIPDTLVQASSDLRVKERRIFRSVVLPLSLPGAIVGAMFTFVLASGDFLAPELVGGIKGFTCGRLVFSQFGLAFNWPLGAALSVPLMAVALVVISCARWMGRSQWQKRAQTELPGAAARRGAGRTGCWVQSPAWYSLRYIRTFCFFPCCHFSEPGAGRCSGTASPSTGAPCSLRTKRLRGHWSSRMPRALRPRLSR